MMHSFRDAMGRDWSVAVNVTTARAIKARCGHDLLGDGEYIKTLLYDVEQAVNVLWVCCERQATERGISDVDFGEGFAGDVFDAASNALMEAIVDFSPSSRREAVRQAIARTKQLGRTLMDAAQEKLSGKKVDEAITNAVAKAMAEVDLVLSGSSSTSAQAS